MKTEKGSLVASVILLVATVVAESAAESPPVPSLRLGNEVHPSAYSAELVVVPERSNFTGQITIELVLAQRASFFWLHGHGLTVTNAYLEQQGRQIPAQPVIGGEEFLGFELQQPAIAGKAKLFVSYSGSMSDKDFSGLFRREEDGKWYAAKQMEA